MEVIKQYVDLLIKRQEESLEYQRVHSEWEALQTNEAKEMMSRTKEQMESSEEEITRLYHVLKEKGLVVGGEHPWGAEMMRYTNWLVENPTSGIQPITAKD